METLDSDTKSRIIGSQKQIKYLERLQKPCTAQKVSNYGVFSGPYFPVFGLNMKIYSVNLHIQSKYGKIRTTKKSAFGHFLRSDEITS